MSTNLQNSIWPNNDGNLGNIKVQIPTGADNDPWPTGDALVNYFVFNKGKLVGLVDTKALIANTSKSTTFPYDYVNIQLDKSLEGVMTFNGCAKPEYLNITYTESGNSGDIITLKYKGCKTVDDIKAVDPNYKTTDIIDGVWSEGLADLTNGYTVFQSCHNLTEFTSDLSSLTNGWVMFAGCSNLTSFNADLSSLTDGEKMFSGCSNLTSFNADLSSLTDGEEMFYKCSKLETFSSDLPNMTSGHWMFRECSNLTSFTSELPSLTAGSSMFEDCINLTTFACSDLSKMMYADFMFSGCTKLTAFNADLSSLTSGPYMFYGCKLDTASVQHIADTINTVSDSSQSKKLDIGIGNSSPNEQEVAAFNQMVDKGWIVFVNSNYYGGDDGGMYGYTASASLASSLPTLDEMGESEMFNPKPYWAKPVPSDEQHAQYTDSEGNFYNILGAQFIYGDNLETYGMFVDEEDAAAQMRLTKIEK